MAKVNWNKRDFSRQLRHSQTDAEKRLWTLLRSKQLFDCKFRRQHVVGPYITDFCCLDRKLVIELDGGQHAENQEHDIHRTRFLEQKGFVILRFWDNQILKEPQSVIESISRALTLSLSHPADGRGDS